MDAPERASENFSFGALIGEAVPQADCEGSAQSVQSISRVRADEIDSIDGNIGDEIPVGGIAKRLIESRAVDVNSEALRITDKMPGNFFMRA